MKGLAALLPAVQIMVAIGFTLGLGLLVLNAFTGALSGTAGNAVNSTIVAISNITTNLGVAGTLIGIVAIVAVAGYALYGFLSGGQGSQR